MNAILLGIAIFALGGLMVPMSVPSADAHKGKIDSVCELSPTLGGHWICTKAWEGQGNILLIREKGNIAHWTLFALPDDDGDGIYTTFGNCIHTVQDNSACGTIGLPIMVTYEVKH